MGREHRAHPVFDYLSFGVQCPCQSITRSTGSLPHHPLKLSFLSVCQSVCVCVFFLTPTNIKPSNHDSRWTFLNVDTSLVFGIDFPKVE